MNLYPFLAAFKAQVARLKNPPLSEEDVLSMFKKLKLTKTVSALKALL